MKPVRKGPPKPAPIEIPFGHPSLVEAAAKLAAQHVFSDVTKTVRALQSHQELSGVRCWDRFLKHTGWVDPGGRIALLDFSHHFPHAETIEGLRIDLTCQGFTGGNGEPLYVDEDVVDIRLEFDKEAHDGSLRVYYSAATSPEWNEWMEEVKKHVKFRWIAHLSAGDLAGMGNRLNRERTLTRVLGGIWCREKLQQISKNLALDLVVVDQEEDAEEFCSSLEYRAETVNLVSPWLAEQLKQRGAVADIVGGLPLWSRESRDAPHLERVLQDVAYQSFSQSMTTELASPEEKP